MRLPLACLAAAFALVVQGLPTAHAGEVTIYRCTDAHGAVTVRDTPCAKGQQQETRSMLRPKDAPSSALPASVAVPSTSSVVPTTRVVVIAPPQPMYECTTPDGNRYTSDSPEGNPRWVPLWTLGYPVLAEGTRYQPGTTSIVRRPDGRVDVNVQGGGYVHGPVPTLAAYGTGTWIRDRCHMLPPAEACARLRDRREEIETRFFNAQPSERDQLRREERGIDARLDNDCSSH